MDIRATLKGLIVGRSEQPRRKGSGPASPEPFVCVCPYEGVSEDYWFCANIQLHTPLAVLEKHGEVHPGPPSELPRYSTARDGIWLPRYKSWSARKQRWSMERITQTSPASIDSDIGPIPRDGGDYLHFVKDFRRIIEASDSVDSKIAKLNALFHSSTTYQAFAKKHGTDLATTWFMNALYTIPGVRPKTAQVLFAAGYRTLEELKAADDLVLQELPRLNPDTVKRIRSFVGSPAKGQQGKAIA